MSAKVYTQEELDALNTRKTVTEQGNLSHLVKKKEEKLRKI